MGDSRTVSGHLSVKVKLSSTVGAAGIEQLNVELYWLTK